MQKPDFLKAVLAGIAGTIAMTMLILAAPMMGMPPMDIAGMLADFMKMSVILGWVAHFMIGSVWGIAYAYIGVRMLPGAPWQKGLLFSIVPWLMMQTMASPMMGTGVFFSSTSSGMMMVAGSLMGHLFYGAVLGLVYTKLTSRGTVSKPGTH